MAELAGHRLGALEISRLIGSGAFATVYEAYDPRLDSRVAVKLLADNHAVNPEIRERFINEAQTLRRIGPPSVVCLHDIGETDDRRPYLVLELADRGNLVDRQTELQTNGWKPTATDVSCLIDALGNALAVIHGHGLVHRDIAPSNVLIRSGCEQLDRPDCSVLQSDERFVLADLGLVKDLSAGSGLTAGGGTVGFSAPEQRSPACQVDERTDVYGASAVILWLVANDQPGNDPALIASQLASAGWPARFASELERGMAADADDRHESIRAWREGLVEALAGPHQARSPLPHSGQRPLKRRHLVATAALVVAGAGAVGYAVGTMPGASTEEPLAAVQTTTTAATTPTTADAEPTQVVQEDAPVPSVGEAFLAPRDDATSSILVVAWGENAPDWVVGTEVQVAVDGGPWLLEVITDIPVAAAWEIWSTGEPEARSSVEANSTYSVRVRWALTNGLVSRWSDPVAAESR